MSPDLTCLRSCKRMLRGWGTILFLCLLGAVAAIGVRALIESARGVMHTRYEPVDVPPQPDSARHEREREERERQGRVVLEKEN